MASKLVILPQPFQGTTSWNEWIEHFKRVAVVNEWTSNATKLKWLKVRLIGKVATAMKHLSEDAGQLFESERGAEEMF